jgi:riboflavin kinase/FMN adenylyltransferase
MTQVFRGLDQVPGHLGPTVVTVGMFDGVHLGHRALLGMVVGEARERGLPAGAVTFDRHPMEVVRPGAQPPLLTTLDDKLGLLAATGLDFILVLPFTAALAQVPADEFAGQVLFGALGAKAVLVGYRFRFGHRAVGDLQLLTELGEARGVEVTGADLLVVEGEVVSATRIRGAVARGDVQVAARLLGRPHALPGRVVEGDRRGRALGVPTANLRVPSGLAVPARGVYAGHLQPADGAGPAGPLPAVTSVGVNPTFGAAELRVEAHVLDFDGDLYGRLVRVSFEHRLRSELTFPGAEELVAQMRDDITASRRLLGVPPPAGGRAL